MDLDIGHPGRRVFVKKSGAVLREECWFCEYDGEFKTCLTPVNLPNARGRNTSTPAGPRVGSGRGCSSAPDYHRPPVLDLGDLSAQCENSEDPDTGLSPDEEMPDNLSFWFTVGEYWAFRSRAGDPLFENVERVRLPPHEISALEGMVADVVDDSKYYITVNSLTSVMTVRWKHAERGLHWARFTRAKKTIDSMGFKKFHSSSISSLSLSAYLFRVCDTRKALVYLELILGL